MPPLAPTMLLANGAISVSLIRERPGGHGPHYHNVHQVCVPIANDVEVDFNYSLSNGRQKRLSICNDKILVIPAGVPHAGTWNGRWLNVSFFIETAWLDEFGYGICTPETINLAPAVGAHDQTICHLVMSLLQAWQSDEVLPCDLDTFSDALAVCLLRRHTRAIDQRFNTQHACLTGQRLKLALEYIEANLGEALTLKDLATLSGLSAFHFARAFKAALDLPPHQYLVLRRITRARKLLANTKLPIVEIAGSTGFSSQAHLTKVFRRYTGTTPHEFRRAARC